MIATERLEFSVDMLIELLKINGDAEVEIEGTKYKVKYLMTQLNFRNQLIEWILKDEMNWQKILRFLSDSYFYVTGQSDDPPTFEKDF